jgi:endonuclease/exonuclease/phosphatase family metal-dependent hydrolase
MKQGNLLEGNRRSLLCLLLLFLPVAQVVPAQTLRIMSFNIWAGGEEGKQPLSQTAEVIRAAKADIVGLQETHGIERAGKRLDNGPALAQTLGWTYFDQDESTGILSRYPIVTNTPGRSGALVRIAPGKEVWIFNVHFAHAPYQPYQLLSIPYANGRFINTEREAVLEARKARGEEVMKVLKQLQPTLASGKGVFLTGDFNEPSHQDWTERAAKAGKAPIAVKYPATLDVTSAGMRDTYRLIHKDEVTHRGNTWTPTTSPDDPKDRHDRIDFVFVGGREVKVRNCEVVGEDAKYADILVQPYPSDHRGVVTTVEFDW